jgi:hypothetical protein
MGCCRLEAIFMLFLCCAFGSHSVAQDRDSIPTIVAGDSTSLRPGGKVMITGTISSNNGSAVPGASISADLFKHFDYADAYGRYILEMPPGRYRVTVRSLGMKPYYFWLVALSDDLIDITLEEGAVELSEIVISSRAIDSNIKQSLSGLMKLNVQEIRTLPSLMGEVDIVRTLQLMPGVSSVGEGSSGFNVRGGRTDQNLVLLNDVPLFNTSHALGFVSAFNQDIIRDFTLYKGAVPAQYGGRASSALEVTTRRGNLEEWKYQGGVGLITSRFTAEGPLVKSATALLVAGRISHAGWFLNNVSDPDVRNSKAFFYDAFTSVSHNFSERSSAEITWYTSRDDFGFSDQFKYSWNSHVVNASWKGLADRKASPSASLSFGQYNNKLIDPSPPDARQLTHTLNYLKLKSAVSYIHEDQHNATMGFEVVGYFPRPEKQEPYAGDTGARRRQVDRNQGVAAALFINDDFKISEDVALNVGLRYSRYAHIGPDTVFSYRDDAPRSTSTITDTTFYTGHGPIKWFGGLEPRVSLRVNLTESQSIKLAYNRMFQYIHQVSNTTAPTPVDLWQVSNEYMPPQIADSYSIGYFHNLSDNIWETSAEVFYKDMRNLVEYKDFPELYLNTHPETELRRAKGRAYGAELYIRKLKGRWTGWLSYSWSQTEVRVPSPFPTETVNGGEWYPSHYNRPHNFNLVVNRVLRGRGAFSIIFSYYSGRPLTAIEDSYIVGDAVVPVYSDRNKYTIPNYMRLDFSFTIGSILRKVDDSLVFSIYNLLGRDNAYSVFYKRPVPTFYIPVPYRLAVLGSPMPSLTYNFKF